LNYLREENQGGKVKGSEVVRGKRLKKRKKNDLDFDWKNERGGKKSKVERLQSAGEKEKGVNKNNKDLGDWGKESAFAEDKRCASKKAPTSADTVQPKHNPRKGKKTATAPHEQKMSIYSGNHSSRE